MFDKKFLYFLAAIIAVINGDDVINWNLVKSPSISYEITKPSESVQRNNIQGRIFNGNTVEGIQEFPYQVGLLQNHKDGFQTWCGGAIISSTVILTAGHCLWDILKAVIFLGATNRKIPGPNAVKIPVTKKNFYIHEGFDHIQNYNDLALIRLETPIEFNEFIQSIDLINPKDKINLDNQVVVTSGWGLTNDKELEVHDSLQYTNIKIISDEQCQAQIRTFGYPTNRLNSKTFICADDKETSGVCEGDSGGAVVIKVNGKRTLIGVNAFVVFDRHSKCEKVYGRVFTRVSEHLNWICKNGKVCNNN